MIKYDFTGQRLYKNDWVKYETPQKRHIGRVTKLSVNVNNFINENTPFQITSDIEITRLDGVRSIRSGFYVEKITEDEAMLFMLES